MQKKKFCKKTFEQFLEYNHKFLGNYDEFIGLTYDTFVID